jgi:hypothetical protein
MRFNHLIELLGPALYPDSVADTTIPELRDERRCDEFALIHSAPLEENNYDQPAEQKQRYDIRPEVEIVDCVSDDGTSHGHHSRAVVLVAWIDLTQSIVEESLAPGRMLRSSSAWFTLGLAEGWAGNPAKHDRDNHTSDDR